MPIRNRVRDRWYYPSTVAAASAGTTTTNWATGDTYAWPVWFVEDNYVMQEIGLVVTATASARSRQWRVGVYDDGGGYPTTVKSEFGVIDQGSPSTTGIHSVSGSATLTKHTLYWIVAKLDALGSGTEQTTVRSSAAAFLAMHPYGAPASWFATTIGTVYGYISYTGQGTSSLPDLSAQTIVQGPGTRTAPPLFIYRGYTAASGADHWSWSEADGDLDSWAWSAGPGGWR